MTVVVVTVVVMMYTILSQQVYFLTVYSVRRDVSAQYIQSEGIFQNTIYSVSRDGLCTDISLLTDYILY